MIMLAIVLFGIGLTAFATLCESSPVWNDEAQCSADLPAPAAEHA